jgi:hypothetical protein
VKQYQELKQQVEIIQTKKENVQQGWMNPSCVRAPATNQLPVMQNTSQLNFMNHILHLDPGSLARQIQMIQDLQLDTESKAASGKFEAPNDF